MSTLGPHAQALHDELRRYVITEPRPFAVDLARSTGMYLHTVDGERLFDWCGYYGAKLVAHNHPALYEPAYTERLLVAANNKIANPDFLTAECVAYYRALHALASKVMQSDDLEVYVVNSGAEAVENMMKYLINLHHERLLAKGRMPGTQRFVYFDQAFHGRTVFALNVTHIAHDPVMTKDFQGIIPGNIQVPFPAIDSDASDADNLARAERSLAILRDAFMRYGDEIVAVIVEPIQGAGGHRVAPVSFFQELSKLCHEFDVQLGFDEVQTAGGQTGTFFAVERFNLPYPPQALASGKKLGNGVVTMRHPMRDHGVLDSTWGGTLADMVRFVQEFKIVEEEHLIERVAEKEVALVAVLQDLVARFPELIHNVRGYGLYQGFSLRNPAHKGRLIDLAREQEHLLLLGAGSDSIRLRPHLHVTLDDIVAFQDALGGALAALREELAGTQEG